MGRLACGFDLLLWGSNDVSLEDLPLPRGELLGHLRLVTPAERRAEGRTADKRQKGG